MNKLKYAVILLLGLSMTFMTSCTKDPNNGGNGGGNGGGNNSGGGGNGTYNGHAYVDLGLPSGTLWATCNVGANSPEEYGDYFAWGETEPKAAMYDWDHYKYSNGTGDEQGLTKYCHRESHGHSAGYHGFFDNLTSLEPIDDAATANWGEGWCMPTPEQWKELWDCTFKRCDYHAENGIGTNGWWFIDDYTGERIFLPAAGMFCPDGLEAVNSDGHYWSNSLGDYWDTDAWKCCFTGSGECPDLHNLDRYFGLPVRPVRSVRKN